EPGPDDLDEPWPYEFRPGQSVWVKASDGNWYGGEISGSRVKRGPTRQKEGVFYPVAFRLPTHHNIRKFFAPLNGEIKPDSRCVRKLLREAG
ncbi:hypothetical protein K488DRAFT_25057, partial [Vararia minispora EC-137]